MELASRLLCSSFQSHFSAGDFFNAGSHDCNLLICMVDYTGSHGFVEKIIRGVAQSGRVLALGARCLRFKS